MNKILIFIVAVIFVSCGSNPSKNADQQIVDMHNAANSLDYQGVYKGTLPAADCPGIEITLTLADDGTFKIVSHYIERNTFDDKGTYTVDGNTLTLKYASKNNTVEYYKVEEGKLLFLDKEKRPITGALATNYILNKIGE